MLAKTAGELIAEIKMLVIPQKKCYLLVEGDFDYKFWVTKIIADNVELVNCSGKENVIKAIEINGEQKLVIMLGLLDQDYGYFFRKNIQNRNIIYTDFNDLETTCFSFGIHKNILQANCDVCGLKKEFSSLEDYLSIFSSALFIGKLRYLSHKNNWHIPFEAEYSIGKYYKNSNFDTSSFLTDISNFLNIDSSDLEKEMDLVPLAHFWHIVQGHDCYSNIYNIVQKYKLHQLGNVNLTSLILTLVSSDLLCQTEMYKKIKYWEQTQQQQILSI